MSTKLGKIHGSTVYGELNHKGKGRIWLNRCEGHHTIPVIGAQVIIGVLGILSAFSGGILFSPIIWITTLGFFVSGRCPYTKSVWNVGPKRSLFRITVPTALMRITKHLKQEHKYEICCRKQNETARQRIFAIQEAMKELNL